MYSKRGVLPGMILIGSMVLFGLSDRVLLPIALLLFAYSVLLRVFIRTWIGEHTRFNHMEVGELIVHGPFAHVRNPLYLSNVLAAFSWLMFLNLHWGLILPLTLSLFFNWHLVILEEEEYLSDKFPMDYPGWKSITKRWFDFKLLSLPLLNFDSAKLFM